MSPKPPTKLWNRNFTILWLGLVQSALGDAFLAIGLMWLALELTGSPATAATILVLQGIPALFGPFAGAVVDRSNKQHLMIGSDLLSGIILLGIFAANHFGVLQIWHLYGLVVLLGTISIFYEPSLRTVLPSVVPDDKLPAANSLFQGGIQVSMIAGTSLAGITLALFGVSFALLLDGVSFIVSALSLYLVRFPPEILQSTTLKVSGLFHDMVDGLRFILKTREVLILTLLAFFINLVLSPVNVIFPIFSRDVLGADVAGFGFLASAIACGLLLGNVLTGVAGDRLTYFWSIFLGLVGMSVALLSLSFVQTLVLALIVTMFLGMMAPMIQIPMVSRLQRAVPQNYQGRVFASLGTFVSISLPLAAALAGRALVTLPVPLIFRIGAIGTITVVSVWIVFNMTTAKSVDVVSSGKTV